MNELASAISDYEDFFLKLSEISAILGPYNMIDPNTRADNLEEEMDHGSRTEVYWNCGATFIFEPELRFQKITEVCTLELCHFWEECSRTPARENQFLELKKLKYLNLIINHGIWNGEIVLKTVSQTNGR
tara:strand:+ start:391 stop:780 length:390 start_codon:yes stop_codon:yes gene_type:complete